MLPTVSTLLLALPGDLWWWLAALLLAAAVQAWLHSPTGKGWRGERAVRRQLRALDPSVYHQHHNLTLRLADGSTTQIDHVLLSIYGVWVLETKHLRGWIFGSARQKLWTQQIFRHRTRFQNPLHQNWRHVMALQALLGLEANTLHSVVVFVGDNTIKTALPPNVVQLPGLLPYLQGLRTPQLSDAQVQALHLQLQQLALPADRATHQAHLQSLRTRHAAPATAPLIRQQPQPDDGGALHQDTVAPANGPPTSCPTCGSGLLQRHLTLVDGRQPTVWRCQRFPDCRYLWHSAVETTAA